MDYKEYEEITAALYRAMGQGSGLAIEGWGASCRIKGNSGSWYQIDVLTKQSNGLQTVRTAIECKFWKKRVTRNVVSNLVTLLQDTNIEKGVIVSKEGFTTGAIALAKQRNISLVEMRKPNDADWEGKLKTIHIHQHITAFEPYDVKFVQPPQYTGEIVQFSASVREVFVNEPGKEPKTLDQIVNSPRISNTSPDEEIEVKFSNGTTMQVLGFEKHASLEAVCFKVKHHVIEKDLVIDADDAIRLIVKEVFEGRQLNIGHDGMITEVVGTPNIADQKKIE